jgi:hypothetical protein
MAEKRREKLSGLEATGISEKIVKPENCALAIAIPTSIEAFRSDRGSRPESFAQLFPGGWSQYSRAIISPFQRHWPELIRLKAQLRTDLTLQEFGDLFHVEGIDVVILFSHWDTHSVEFFDGSANVASIVQKVPRAYTGILDLCVCQQATLACVLRQKRPDCIIGFTNRRATPYRWLYFYVLVLKYLSEYNLTYFEAVEKAFSAVVNGRGNHL